MRKIYFTLDSEGFLEGWGSIRSTPEEFGIEVDEDHEVLRNPEVFKYVDGELIKDEVHQQQLIEKFDKEQNELTTLEKLERENEMLAMAVMELTQAILNGGD